MKLEVLPARKGDCLILHHGDAADPRLILIDGGPAGVWEESLEPRLEALREERRLPDDEPLVIDLVIVSHVDDDHINGILKLFKNIKERRDDDEPARYRVERLWHNSFDDVLGNDETSNLVRASRFGAASSEADLTELVESAEHGPEQDAALILAGIRQGDQLRDLAAALEIPLNPEVDAALIRTPDDGRLELEVGEVKFTVIGPRQKELAALQRDHDEWLRKQPAASKQPHAFLAALDDESVANLSSIVLLAEAEGTRILLTGDARSDFILKGMEESGLLDEDGKCPVDILKMPHHGSIRNLDDEGDFLRRVPARHYIFSGNGEHGNPDRETFDLLFASRPNEQMELYLTYRIADIDPKRRHEHEHERSKRQRKGKSPGPAWNDASNGLAAILSPAPPNVQVHEHDGSTLGI